MHLTSAMIWDLHEESEHKESSSPGRALELEGAPRSRLPHLLGSTAKILQHVGLNTYNEQSTVTPWASNDRSRLYLRSMEAQGPPCKISLRHCWSRCASRTMGPTTWLTPDAAIPASEEQSLNQHRQAVTQLSSRASIAQQAMHIEQAAPIPRPLSQLEVHLHQQRQARLVLQWCQDKNTIART